MVNADQTVVAALQGYSWLPRLRRRSGGRPVPLRVLGQRAMAIGGPEAARFFYGRDHLERHTALPALVVGTLFGRGAVHTLDGPRHRARKVVFTTLLLGEGIDEVAKLAGEAFEHDANTWRPGQEVVLFDAAARAITRGVTRWTGVPVGEDEMDDLSADLIAMVDGFATVGPRSWRALTARRRRERWLAAKIEDLRRTPETAGETALARIAAHREGGRLLDARTAAVEVLNIIRPATAVAWFVAYTAHALHHHPEHGKRLRAGDDEFTTAFVHEVRRYYPFAPFLGGRARRDLEFAGTPIAKGTLVLLDVYGQHHDPALWPGPEEFRPERFLGHDIGEFELIPQGGGDPRTGHRCPGEKMTIAILGRMAQIVAGLPYTLPPQDLSISLRRIPAHVAGGVRLSVGTAGEDA